MSKCKVLNIIKLIILGIFLNNISWINYLIKKIFNKLIEMLISKYSDKINKYIINKIFINYYISYIDII